MFNLIEWLYLKQKDNLVFYDRQTKIFNRNWWELVGEKKYKNNEAYFTIIDLNYLKEINDSKGHLEGDLMIRKIVSKLKQIEMSEVCRLGGDEFLLISKANPYKVLKEINEKNDFSFGTCYKNPSMTIKECMTTADERMYFMKLAFH